MVEVFPSSCYAAFELLYENSDVLIMTVQGENYSCGQDVKNS